MLYLAIKKNYIDCFKGKTEDNHAHYRPHLSLWYIWDGDEEGRIIFYFEHQQKQNRETVGINWRQRVHLQEETMNQNLSRLHIYTH